MAHYAVPDTHRPFAHPSEDEFARILNFYGVQWLYEPRSFPLRWDGARVVEMFTPDYYLPDLDLYIELTTLKQSLVTEKNRKLVELANREIARELGQRRPRLSPAFLQVTRVVKGSAAHALGIEKGDLLLGIVDRVPEMFRTSKVLRTYSTLTELNDSFHVLAGRYRNAEYEIWLLREGEFLDGPLDVRRL